MYVAFIKQHMGIDERQKIIYFHQFVAFLEKFELFDRVDEIETIYLT